MTKRSTHVPGTDRRFARRVADLISGGRAGLEQGAYSQNLLAPYNYNLAGLDVEYEDRSPRMQQLQAQHDRSTQLLDALNKTGKGTEEHKKILQFIRGSGEYDGIGKSGAGKVKEGALRKYLRKQAQGGSTEMMDLANAPLRIKSIKENADAKATRQREDALYAQEQGMLKDSLSMNNEDVLNADPALRRQLAEEQARLDQGQVQQFGSLANAQGGSIGAVQNAAMMQRRSEAISNARRENIGLYAGLQTQQGGFNMQKRGAQQALGAAPSQAQQQSGLNFGQLAQDYNGVLQAHTGATGTRLRSDQFNAGNQPDYAGAAKDVGAGIGAAAGR